MATHQHWLTCTALPETLVGLLLATQKQLSSTWFPLQAWLAGSLLAQLCAPAAAEAGSTFLLPSWGSVQCGCQKRRAIVNQSHLSLLWLLVETECAHIAHTHQLCKASVGDPGMVTGSTACVLVINLTCSVLASIPCVMNMPTSGRQNQKNHSRTCISLGVYGEPMLLAKGHSGTSILLEII